MTAGNWQLKPARDKERQCACVCLYHTTIYICVILCILYTLSIYNNIDQQCKKSNWSDWSEDSILTFFAFIRNLNSDYFDTVSEWAFVFYMVTLASHGYHGYLTQELYICIAQCRKAINELSYLGTKRKISTRIPYSRLWLCSQRTSSLMQLFKLSV